MSLKEWRKRLKEVQKTHPHAILHIEEGPSQRFPFSNCLTKHYWIDIPKELPSLTCDCGCKYIFKDWRAKSKPIETILCEEHKEEQK